MIIKFLKKNLKFYFKNIFVLSKITFQPHFVKFGQLISITLIKLNNSMWGPHLTCRDPSLGLVTKVRVYKGVGWEWNTRVTFHAPRSVGGFEGMNPHNPKWTLTLGVEVLMDSQIIKEKFQGLEIIGLKISLHYSKALET